MVSSEVSLSHYVPEFTIEIDGKETSQHSSPTTRSLEIMLYDQIMFSIDGVK